MCPWIDIDEFGKRVKNEFDGKTAGWAYCIKDLSRPDLAMRFGHGGCAVLGFDPAIYPQLPATYEDFQQFIKGVPQRYYKPMEIMSMSKTITAAAVVKLIQGRKNDSKLHATSKALLTGGFDSPIWPFLPGDWELGPHVETITFRHLLNHATNFYEYDKSLYTGKTRRVAGLYNNMRKSVAKGLTHPLSAQSGYTKYQNINYGLFRILLPYVTQDGGIPSSTKQVPVVSKLEQVRLKLGPKGQEVFENLLGIKYVEHVRTEILAPMGLSDISVYVHSGEGSPPATRYYSSPDSVASLADYPYPFKAVGATEWKMSCKSFLQFLVGLAKGAVAPPAQLWNMMLDNGYGVERYGGIAGHGGDGETPRLHSGWIYAPSLYPGKGLIAVAQINSDVHGSGYNDSSVVVRLANIYSEL